MPISASTVTLSDEEDEIFQPLYTHHFIPDGPPAPFSEDFVAAETVIPESADDVAEILCRPIENQNAVAKSFMSVNLCISRVCLWLQKRAFIHENVCVMVGKNDANAKKLVGFIGAQLKNELSQKDPVTQNLKIF